MFCPAVEGSEFVTSESRTCVAFLVFSVEGSDFTAIFDFWVVWLRVQGITGISFGRLPAP